MAALNHDRNFFVPMLKAYKERHDLVYEGIKKIPGLKALPADGTFYLFVDATEAIQKLGLKDDVALSELLLEKAHVAMVPGSAFGTPGHIRISYATSKENLIKALGRMQVIF